MAPKVDEKGVALKEGEKAALYLTPLNGLNTDITTYWASIREQPVLTLRPSQLWTGSNPSPRFTVQQVSLKHHTT